MQPGSWIPAVMVSKLFIARIFFERKYIPYENSNPYCEPQNINKYFVIIINCPCFLNGNTVCNDKNYRYEYHEQIPVPAIEKFIHLAPC